MKNEEDPGKEKARGKSGGRKLFSGRLLLIWGLLFSAALVLIGLRVLRDRSDSPPIKAAGQADAQYQQRPPADAPPRLESHDDAQSHANAQGAADATASPEEEENETAGQASKELKGILVFPPLGTNPTLSGIIVPDDYTLPPGYVRHYQSTDDGRQLEPILMYHPDYQPLDQRGAPVPLPPDRVVPPEQAPPGLPIVMLEVPESTEESIPMPKNFDPQKPKP